MKHTVRYAHLESVSVKEGQTIKEGDVIGNMGNTGQSFGAHLHIDVVRGRQTKIYTLAEIEAGKYTPEPKQLNYFIDEGLFKSRPRITTHYCDAEYMRTFKKLHYGYDIIPLASTKAIYWNRSKLGNVSAVFENHSGYGNCVYITFEA